MTVSILIPAFRPTFLRQTIASALTQGSDDFELIVSDDSGDDKIEPIVERFRDPRLRYVRTAGRIGAAANCERLWDLATRERLLFLLDDDLLMPHAVVELSAQLDDHPEAVFCWGGRYRIDARGRLTADPLQVEQPVVVTDHQVLVRTILARMTNPIGELSNVLINRAAGPTFGDLRHYRGHEMKVMGDISFFINASRRGPVVAISTPVSSFRQHDQQLSSARYNPLAWLTLPEWELFLRGEYAAGVVPDIEAKGAVATIRQGYANWASSCPPLKVMIPGCDALAQSIAIGDRNVFSDDFRARLAQLVQDVSRWAATSPGSA